MDGARLPFTVHASGGAFRPTFNATSVAYLEHGGPDDVEIGVLVSYGGANEWWSFGWNGNSYETSVTRNEAPVDAEGEWVQLRGWHTEGAGSYPRIPPTPL